MVLRILAILVATAAFAVSAAAQERVAVATMRNVSNGALFIAAARGYFKAEGVDVDMTAYASDADIVKVLASGGTDFGFATWSAPVFKLAGQGAFKAVAGQLREKDGFEGHEIVASNTAYARGIRKLENFRGAIVALDQFGTILHYQLAQTALAKGGYDFASLTLKQHGTPAAAAREIAEGRADVAVLPMPEARSLLTTNQAKLIAWYSQVGEPELSALFASAKMLGERRAAAEKFVRAYRRGVADYYVAFLRLDRYSKRISNAQSVDAAQAIARYVYPRAALTEAAATVEAEIPYMDAQARIDTADIAKQLAWYQAAGFVDKGVDAKSVVDMSFK